MTEKSFSEALSTSATSSTAEKRSSLSIPVTSPRTNEEDLTAFSQNTVADNSKTQAREQRASSLASPFSFAGSLWTCSSSESVTGGGTSITGNAMDTASLSASLLPSWSTPTPTIENTPRRASLSTSASASWKCVGAGASAATVEDVINGSIGGSINASSNTTTATATARQRSASLSALTSMTTNSFASIVSSTKPLLSASEDESVLDPVDEAVELFKRTSMDSLLDFPATSNNAANANAFSQSTLLSGLSAAQRRHSLNWISSIAPEIAPGIAPGKSAAFTNTSTASLFDDLPDFSAGSSVLETTSSHPSSPEFDTFPEDFMASNAVTAASSNFSKKRFARRHSIATDMALEESFASFSFDQGANGGGAVTGSNAYPFNGNVMAAYSGLLCEDGSSIGNTGNGSTCTSTNTSTSAFSNTFAHNDTIINSMLKYANASAASGATPAQAGIAPTALSFPHATFNLQAHKGMLFLIEFKAGRTEIFYVLDADVALSVKVGDLVIVEADRGEDLGRITGEMPGGRIRQLIAQLPHDSLSSALASQFDDSVAANGANVNHNLAGLKDFEIAALIASKEISPKRIHRHATPMDVRFLQAKAQEEALAMVRCQARIKQKKLPMEVVDAEYQWDRNKLTFYFAAERRIDFRELVRDLFRIYKTRIWMCAVDKNRAALLNSIASTYK